ncbi:2-oxoglutarate dehydrogenase complex dihydrolipoyllysine-residue succinyltransferase [Methylomagnum sp.]
MRIEVKVPDLPESVSDATLLDWHKKPGEAVGKNENLVDLETDKVVLEVPVPESGILQEVRRSKGDIVTSGDLLAVIETEAKPAAVAESIPAPVAVPELVATAAPEPVQESAEQAEPATQPLGQRAVFNQSISPAVRRLLMEHNLDPADIPIAGRLTKQVVTDYLQSRQTAAPAPSPAPAATPARPQPAATPKPASASADSRGERRVPMTRLRARIAERLIEAQRTTATLTTFNEVNLQKIFDLRNQYRAKFEKDHKVKLGFMSFFVKAAVEALKRFPVLNASLEGDAIVYHDYYDIGIAVSSERGLVVPVLRNADGLGFGEIEKAINEFGQKGRDGKLTFEELNGGTFTITNGGIFGSMLSTPILNPPQSAILGMHAIKERAVVEDGQIVIRPMIYLALSYDHRIIDGREAVSCLFTIKELLEDPVRLLLDV